MISLGSRPRQAPWVEGLEQTDQSVVLRSNRSIEQVSLDGVAALIWHLCDGSNTVDTITRLFKDAYPNNPNVEHDVTETLSQLSTQNLLILDGGEQALEYQGTVVRQVTPSIELQWHLEQIRQFIFNIMRLTELGGISADVDTLTSQAALQRAKEHDVDAAQNPDSTVMPFQGALSSASMSEVVNKAVAELKQLLPEVKAPMTLSGNAIYLPGSHMGWHSNRSRSDGRVYCSWADKKDSNFFRYEDPITGKIVTEWEAPGWNVKSFTIPPADARFWHCIGANSLRLSIGFRYNLPDKKS